VMMLSLLYIYSNLLLSFLHIDDDDQAHLIIVVITELSGLMEIRLDQLLLFITYAKVNHFNIANVKREWKLYRIDAHAAKIRLLFFLSNCYTCIHGNSCSRKFDCSRPSLEEYLNF